MYWKIFFCVLFLLVFQQVNVSAAQDLAGEWKSQDGTVISIQNPINGTYLNPDKQPVPLSFDYRVQQAGIIFNVIYGQSVVKVFCYADMSGITHNALTLSKCGDLFEEANTSFSRQNENHVDLDQEGTSLKNDGTLTTKDETPAPSWMVPTSKQTYEKMFENYIATKATNVFDAHVETEMNTACAMYDFMVKAKFLRDNHLLVDLLKGGSKNGVAPSLVYPIDDSPPPGEDAAIAFYFKQCAGIITYDDMVGASGGTGADYKEWEKDWERKNPKPITVSSQQYQKEKKDAYNYERYKNKNRPVGKKK